jgi:Na+/melibiose symporter-like transporter
LIGLLLSMAGYIPSFAGKLVTQPQTAIDALYLGSSLIPAGLAVLSCCLMLGYSLDDRKLKAMAAEAVDRK